jgi:hypothetical protein
MSEDRIRQALLDLPVAPVPADLAVKLRVLASHERERQVNRFGWLKRRRMELNDLFKLLAVPVAGGLLSSLLLFTAMVDTLNAQLYLNTRDVPLGVYTQVSVGNLSPFAGNGEDLMVEVTIDPHGRVSDFSVPNGKVSPEQLRQVGNLLLYSTFTPATADGQPVSGKILVALHHINVEG